MITFVENIQQIEIITKINQNYSYLNEVILQSKEYSSKEVNLTLLNMLNLSKKIPDKIRKYFAIDIMPFNSDIDNIKELLKILIKNNFYGVRTEDLSILNIIEEDNLNLKIILDSTTGGNNINYYNFFSEFKSIERIVLSRELSIEKILEYGKKTKVTLEIQAYGRLQIFHTKRKLIKAIEKNQKKILPKLLYLQEPKRNDEFFPLLETSDGTIMFHSKLLNFHKYQKKLIKFNIIQLIDLRHTENLENYQKILNHFTNIENNDLTKIEKLPFLEIKKETAKTLTKFFSENKNNSNIIEAGTVLDSKKGKEIILKSFIELKLEMEVIFYNNKKKELPYTIKYLNKFGSNIYIIPWRKGVTSNSKFYIRNYE